LAQIPHWKKRPTPPWVLRLRWLWSKATRVPGEFRRFLKRLQLRRETANLLRNQQADSLLEAFNVLNELLCRIALAQEKLAGIHRPSPADEEEAVIDEFKPEEAPNESEGLEEVENGIGVEREPYTESF